MTPEPDQPQPLLLPEVAVFVHEIDTTAHPTYQPGTWRWAVMVGGRPPHDLDACANAGGERSLQAALDAGDQVAAAVTRALRVFGVPAGPPRRFVLNHDPIPAGGDHLNDLRR